jgi:hypothetical protein
MLTLASLSNSFSIYRFIFKNTDFLKFKSCLKKLIIKQIGKKNISEKYLQIENIFHLNSYEAPIHHLYLTTNSITFLFFFYPAAVLFIDSFRLLLDL